MKINWFKTIVGGIVGGIILDLNNLHFTSNQHQEWVLFCVISLPLVWIFVDFTSVFSILVGFLISTACNQFVIAKFLLHQGEYAGILPVPYVIVGLMAAFPVLVVESCKNITVLREKSLGA